MDVYMWLKFNCVIGHMTAWIESCDHFIVSRWSMCSDSMLEILKDYLEPLIAEVAPPGVGK
jgi:hypothetical protein